jgi:hypothetical protein
MRPIGPMLPLMRLSMRHDEMHRREILRGERLHSKIRSSEMLPGGPRPRPGRCSSRTRSGGR